MEEETKIVVSSCGSRKESYLDDRGGGDSKMVDAEDLFLPPGTIIKEVSGSTTTMMSDRWWRTNIPTSADGNVFFAGKGKCAEENHQDDVCIQVKKSAINIACGGLGKKKSKKAIKRKVVCGGIAKTLSEDASELLGHWSGCHKSKKSVVHPIVTESRPESLPPKATLVDEVTHQFSRLNSADTGERGCRSADFDLNELLTELTSFKNEDREHDPDEQGLIYIKFV